MAQEASTLMEVSGGRFRLGIGLSHRPSMVDALGLDMGEPLAVMREYLAVLRAALEGQASFEGRYYRVRWTGAFRAPAPPVLLAGLAPPMLELAGELADGVVLWLCSPGVRSRRGACPPSRAVEPGPARRSRASRSSPRCRSPSPRTTPASRGCSGRSSCRYLSLPYYRTMFRASGFGDALAAFDRDRAPGRDADAVPAALVDALGAIGDARSRPGGGGGVPERPASRCRSSGPSGRRRPPTRAERWRPWPRDAGPQGELRGWRCRCWDEGVLAIWHTITPEGESEYWRWHDREHIPERVGVPGFLRGRRYRSLERSLDYLDLYEVEDPETLRSAPYLARLNDPTPWTRRMVPHFLNTLRVGYRVATSAGRGQGGVLLTLQLGAAGGGGRQARGARRPRPRRRRGRDRGRLGPRAGGDARGHEHRDRGEAAPRPGRP